MRNFKIKKIRKFLNMKKSVGLESTMLSVYTLSSKKRNVLVDPKKYEYNLQSMSSKSFWNSFMQEFYWIVVGEVAVGEISDWGS